MTLKGRVGPARPEPSWLPHTSPKGYLAQGLGPSHSSFLSPPKRLGKGRIVLPRTLGIPPEGGTPSAQKWEIPGPELLPCNMVTLFPSFLPIFITNKSKRLRKG